MKITRRQLRQLIIEAVEKEEQLGRDSIEKYETIGQALTALDKLKIQSRKDQHIQTAKRTATEIPKQAPLIGWLHTAWNTTKDIYNTATDQARNINPALIEDYPILDLFDIHPVFFKVLHGKLMQEIEDEYEKKHLSLSSIDLDASISTLKDINEFIQEYLLTNYNITFTKALSQPREYAHDSTIASAPKLPPNISQFSALKLK